MPPPFEKTKRSKDPILQCKKLPGARLVYLIAAHRNSGADSRLYIFGIRAVKRGHLFDNLLAYSAHGSAPAGVRQALSRAFRYRQKTAACSRRSRSQRNVRLIGDQRVDALHIARSVNADSPIGGVTARTRCGDPALRR